MGKEGVLTESGVKLYATSFALQFFNRKGRKEKKALLHSRLS